jgi:hypothetical protein
VSETSSTQRRLICMSAQFQAARLFLLTAFVCCAGARAEEQAKSPSPERLRAAITRSLAFLSREGDQWMADKDCNACHHLPELLWSHREAKRRGFPIDQAKFAEWVAWAGGRVKDTKPGREAVALMCLAMPDAPPADATGIILEGQQADGTWKPAGQFATMQKRDASEAVANSSRLFLLALGVQEKDKGVAADARVKAAASLARKESPKTVETLVFRALFARRNDSPKEAAALCAELVKLQHADGGWGWWIAEPQGDALATGEVLYLLAQSPDAYSDAIGRAQLWLLSTQGEDGSWLIDITRISRIDRSAPGKAKSLKDATGIYQFWGTAWATIGLLQGVPVRP